MVSEAFNALPHYDPGALFDRDGAQVCRNDHFGIR